MKTKSATGRERLERNSDFWAVSYAVDWGLDVAARGLGLNPKEIYDRHPLRWDKIGQTIIAGFIREMQEERRKSDETRD